MNSTIVQLDQYQKSGEGVKTVLVGGCFDILHIGHIHFLENAKSFGDELVVALESDEFIVQKKNRQPFHTQEERAKILAALRCVDKVILLPLLTTNEAYRDLVLKVHPKVIVVTSGDTKLEYKQLHAAQVGARIEEVSHVPKKSTSEILDQKLPLNKEDIHLDS